MPWVTGATWAAADQLNSGLACVPGGTDVVVGVVEEGTVVSGVAVVGVEKAPWGVERAAGEGGEVVDDGVPAPSMVVVVDAGPPGVECWCPR